MDPATRQGLILGAIVGVFLAAFFVYYTHNWGSLLLIPVAALMGAAPQYLKPKDMEDDD